MSQTRPLDALLNSRHLWRGVHTHVPDVAESTGHAALDAALPLGGWPAHSLIEILLGADGVGELDLLMPTLARLTGAAREVLLVSPPYIAYAPAWQARGVELAHLHVVETSGRHTAWAFEQALRAGCCAAVIAWPEVLDPTGLRRLQLVAAAGQVLGFVIRDSKFAANASPAALRLELLQNRCVLIRKCRGGMPASRPVVITPAH